MVMVTGAEGFIGSHLIKELLKRGYTVKAFDLPLLEHCKNLSEVMKSCINQILIINETKYFSIHTGEIKVKKIKK